MSIHGKIDLPKDTMLRAGMWVAAAFFDNPKARAFCDKNRIEIRAAAQSEGVNTGGGFLVPAEIEAGIIAQRDLAGIFRAEGDVRAMGSDIRSFPKRNTGLTAAFTAENVALTESSIGFDAVTLSAKKAGMLTKLSSELFEDEIVDLGTLFIEEIGNALALTEDGCGFAGDGTPTYGNIRGILTKIIDGNHTKSAINAASGHDTFLEIDATDLGTLMAALPERYWGNAKFYTSGYGAAAVFARLGATAGGVIMTANGPRPQLVYMGIPVVISSKMPSGASSLSGSAMLLFGDLRSASILGSRRGITVKRSVARYFDTDQIGITGTSRFDIVAHSLGDTTNAGAVVALVGA